MIEELHGTRETISFTTAKQVRLYRNDNDECFPPHWHIPAELICPIESPYEVTVGGTVLTIAPHDALFIAPGALHSIVAPPHGVRYILNIDLTPYERLQDISFLLSTMSPFYLLRQSEDEKSAEALFALMTRIAEEYFGQSLYRDSEISSLMTHYFVQLGRYRDTADRLPSNTPGKQQEYSNRFIGICNYINTHCNENLSLDAIAEEAGFSKYHFARLFKEMTGTTCHEYLVNRRIQFAQKLLVDATIPITEVAMRSGFNSLATFNRIFKTEISCTPSEYRKLKLVGEAHS